VANSILLVDTALRARRAGVERDEALVSAARLRVRPVLMTALATIAALLPLAAGLSGEGGIISRSLGAVVIGGLLTATLLTLVIVPAVFSTFDGMGHALWRLFGRSHEPALGGAPAGPAAANVAGVAPNGAAADGSEGPDGVEAPDGAHAPDGAERDASAVDAETGVIDAGDGDGHLGGDQTGRAPVATEEPADGRDDGDAGNGRER
jgi:hypothetical protein